MDATTTVLLLLYAFAATSYAADAFLDVAIEAGKRLRFADYITGSLIVGIGTSLPEFVTSLSAVFHDASTLVVPNVVGTVIANTYAGLGLSVVCLHTMTRKRKLISVRAPLHGGRLDFSKIDSVDSVMAVAIFSVILTYFLSQDGFISAIDSAILLCCYCVFLGGEIYGSSFGPTETNDDGDADAGSEASGLTRYLLPLSLVALLVISPHYREENSIQLLGSLIALISMIVFGSSSESGLRSLPQLILGFIASLVLLAFSGELVVVTILDIAAYSGVSSEKLSASVIALGTSLPDIVVAVIVARKGRHSMLLGHIIQSNVFDVFLILGTCGLIQALRVDEQSASMSLPFAGASYVVLLGVLQDKRITLGEGMLMVIGYISFLVLLFS